MVFIHLKTEHLLEFYQLYELIQVKEYFQARNRLLILSANYNLYEEILNIYTKNFASRTLQTEKVGFKQSSLYMGPYKRAYIAAPPQYTRFFYIPCVLRQL